MTDVAPNPQSSTSSAVLVLGDNARLGKFLSLGWCANRAKPTPFDRVWQMREGGKITAASQDIRLFDPLQDAPALNKAAKGATAILNLAGVVPGREGGQDLSLNTDLAMAALHAAQESGVADVFLLSSAAVYGAPTDDAALKESRALTPAAPYGHAKAEMEEAALKFATQNPEVGVHILRLGNVAGADMLLGGLQQGKPVTLDQFANGGFPRRSYMGPKTMADVFAQLLSNPADVPQILNIATPTPVGMDELLVAADIKYQTRVAPAGALPCVALCTQHLERLFDFTPAQSTAQHMVDEWQALKDRL